MLATLGWFVLFLALLVLALYLFLRFIDKAAREPIEPISEESSRRLLGLPEKPKGDREKHG